MPLSNATQQTLATTPYWDDYYKQNTATGLLTGVDFDFHRVLFRPQRGVQSRELTQLQTLLQVQLERLGNAQFRNGDRLFGGQLTLDVGATSGQVLANTTLTNFFNRDTNEGKYIYSTATPTTKAHVVQYVGIDDGETSNNYLIYRYASSDTFNLGETIQDRDSNNTAVFAASDAFHNASTISIDEGVCFVSGFFVRIRPQTIVLDPLSNTPTYRVGLTISEQILDELDDVVGESLGDPANQGAPGASRLRVRLSLAKKTLETDADDNFIELARVENGVIRANKIDAKYVTTREMEQTLARRTYDESGDYLIRPFAAVVEGSTTANATNAASITDFMLSLAPGKAYVRGFEIETTDVTRLPINKSRSTANVTNSTRAVTIGNYTFVTRLDVKTPGNYFGNTGSVDLHCVPVTNIQSGNTTGGTANASSYNYSRIGTAQVRMVEANQLPADITKYANVASYVGDSSYKLFFFNTQFDAISGNIASATYDSTTQKTTLVVNIVGAGNNTGQTFGANGFPGVNGALNGVSISLDGTSSGIYTIENYTYSMAANNTSGTANLVLREYLTSVPAGNTGFRLLFQPRDIDSFAVYDGTSDVTTPFSDYLAFQADVSPLAKDDGTPSGYTQVYDPNDNSLVYQIPESFIKPGSLSTSTVQFTTWLSSSSNTTGTGVANATVVLNFSNLSDYLSLPSGVLTTETAKQNFIIFDITNDANGRGYIVNFSSNTVDGSVSANATSRCIDTINATSNTVTFTYRNGTNIGSARTLIAVARAQMTGVPARVKDYYIGNTTAVLTSVANSTTSAMKGGQVEYYSLNTTAGFAYSLRTADVINLRAVLYKSSNVAFANTDLATATDVTSYFTLDTGQRDNTYEYSKVTVNRGASAVIAPTGRLLFIFDWFNHSGVGYSYIDSYLSTQNQAKGFTYEDIPDYTSPKSHRSINLRNVIDFRPVRSNYEFVNAALIFAASNTSANTTYLTNTSPALPYLIPASDRTWLASYAYYLSRIDRVSLYPDGQFHVTEGQPAVVATAPTVEPSAMLLYELTVPAYTLVDDAGRPTSVKLKSYDHKRYTMQDLVKVEDRVAHLEYYTALSQLEKAARDQSILDIDNQERFKNGIVVDSFIGTDVADVARTDFAAAIDTYRQELRPTYTYAADAEGRYAFDFSYDPFSTAAISIVGDMAIPTYTTDAFITQPLATHAVSVNPFNITNYYGSLALSPAVDTGKSILPAQVIDMGGPTQAWLDANQPSYTNWGEWETTWTGVTGAATRQDWWVPEGWTADDHPFQSLRVTTYDDVQTATNQQRQGTQFSYHSVATTTSLGNIVVDTSIIHSIRKRDLVFTGSGLKPNTTIYPFFDGTSVQKYLQRANILRLTDISKSAAPSFKVGDTIYVKKPLTGNVSISSSTRTVSGTGTKFSYELLANQLVQIVKGADAYVRYIANVTSNTVATLSDAAPSTISVVDATLYSLTPVTIADVIARPYQDGYDQYVQYTLKVVRANRDSDVDGFIPYTISAGGISPVKLVNDSANTTSAAYVIVGPMNGNHSELTVNSATILSGVVRAYNSAAHTLRLDIDAPATSNTDVPVGSSVYFVGGAGAGQSAIVVGYDAGSQTVTLDAGATLTDITVGDTIYSLGQTITDGFLPAASVAAYGYNVASLTATTPSGYAGSIAGVLHLQENQFPVGNRIFRLTDDASNDVTNASTKAEANYTASGLLSVEQPTSTTTRHVVTTTRSVTETQTINGSATTVANVEWVDPVAQSFLVDGSIYPQGVFIESIDLAFAAKPPANEETPVFIELRPMINGYPSSTQVVPCVARSGKAIATLSPADVNISTAPSFTDTTIYTRFSFPALVHLQAGQEYAIVIRSNSAEYKVYTAQMNQTVIGTTNIVGTQPYAGSFFKSQNASTWTAEQSEDLMFRINRAKWVAGQEASLVLRATPLLTNTSFDAVTFYPYDVNFGNNTSTVYTLDIKPMNPATEDLTGQTAVRYNVYPNQKYNLSARSMAQGRTGQYGHRIAQNSTANTAYQEGVTANTIDVTATMTTYSTDVAPFLDLKKVNAIGLQHQINDMPLQVSQFEIVSPGGSYANTSAHTGTVTTSSGNTIVTGSGTTFTSTLVVGRDVVIGGNIALRVASIDSDVQFTATAAASESRSANVYSTYANLTIAISASTAGSNATGYAVLSATSTTDANGIVTGIVLTSNGSGYLTSPTITLSGTANVVYHGENWITGGNALSRYMIKPVTLADGFEARDLKVYFDAYRPVGTKFYVYYRILPSTADISTLNDESWRLMTQETSDAIVSSQPNQYREFEFRTPNSVAANASTDTTDQFKIFAVKVVMASDDTTVVPAIKNFRVIALER